MRFSTLMPLLLAAGVAHAQFGQGGQGQFGQGQGGQGQGGQGQGGQGGQGQQGQGQGGQGQQGQGQNGQGQQGQNGQGQNGQDNGQGNGGNALCLNAANVQDASQVDGQDGAAEAGQAASATDEANFINFCDGKTLTNGLQVKEGSCNGIVMGDIPASSNMVSAVFTNPQNGDDINENEQITFTVQVANLQAGSFTNPDNTYYAAPQALQGGNIVGHTHITVQEIGQGGTPPSAEDFAFFKGINDDGDGNGALSADLAAGLPAGNYRACSLTSASNHQPVIMPVAQRGAQDDCIRFTVGQGGGNNNGQNGQGQQGQDQQGQQGQGQQGQQGQGQQGQQGQGAQGGQGAGQGGQGAGAGAGGAGAGAGFGAGFGKGKGRGRGRFGRAKFAAREFIA